MLNPGYERVVKLLSLIVQMKLGTPTMAYEILPRPHPSIALVHMFSEIEEEDFRLGDALELDKGNPVYLLVDTTGAAITLPPNFMENVRSSALFNDNLAHVAVFTRSDRKSTRLNSSHVA